MVDVAAWKSVALPILESYSEATDGSFVQDKESAVVWHFHNADPDFGQWQSKELHTHLEDLLGGYPVDVRMGNFTVEIKPKGITKAAAVQAALSHMKAEGRPADLVRVFFTYGPPLLTRLASTLAQYGRDRRLTLIGKTRSLSQTGT